MRFVRQTFQNSAQLLLGNVPQKRIMRIKHKIGKRAHLAKEVTAEETTVRSANGDAAPFVIPKPAAERNKTQHLLVFNCQHDFVITPFSLAGTSCVGSDAN